MNRWDEIQGLARDIASNVHADPGARDAMADDLIKLCGAMIGAVGKVVAGAGESGANDAHDWVFEPNPESDEDPAAQRADFDAAQAAEVAQCNTLYIAGERVQDGAREAVDQASNARCDLDRWTRSSPGDGCRCGHVPKVHNGGRCTGELWNHEPCKGGPCTGFVRREPSGGWRHVDRRPDALKFAALRAAEADPFAVSQPAATPGAPIELGNPEPVNLDGFGATPVAVSQPARPCCYAVSGPCATCRNGGPVGDCCFPLWDACPLHR